MDKTNANIGNLLILITKSLLKVFLFHYFAHPNENTF